MIGSETEQAVVSGKRWSRFKKRFRLDRGAAGEGFVLGALMGLCSAQLGFNHLLHIDDLCGDIFLIFAVCGLIVAHTRARRLLRMAAACTLTLMFLVGYTPLVSWLMPGLARRDPLQPAPAVVVLSSYIHADKSLSASAQERVIQGYAVLRQGYSPVLVLTRADAENGSQIPTVRRQMAALRLDYPIEEVGPVVDTHDEAVAVAKLAKERGWKRVILVTHPWHTRRAAATFEKAGIPVLCAPCVEGDYDLSSLDTAQERFDAFRDWLHESLGYQVYRRRGWL